jgi:hypothetical protein
VLHLTEQISGQLTQKELRELRRLKVVREALDELKKRGVYTDIAVCPNCKSFRIIQLTSSHDLGVFGNFQPAFYCIDCGYYWRGEIIMSNRPEQDAVLEDLKTAFPPLLDKNEDSSLDDAILDET